MNYKERNIENTTEASNDLYTLLGSVINKGVINITKPDADEGFVLHTKDGDTVYVGFSSCEGSIKINGVDYAT